MSERIHFIGIGGVGMSAIALLLAADHREVSGSDAKDSAMLAHLRAAGIDARAGHAADHVDGASQVVVSSAIRESNPELRRAHELGLPTWHRSQALAALASGRDLIAVAGAHGKTTTSAMIAVALHEAGLDPTFAVGGDVLGLGGGAHLGSGSVMVAEADESDGSFLNYHPRVAVVTNVEPDHLDHYGSTEAFEAAFVQFCAGIAPGGVLVAGTDDAGAARLAQAHREGGGRVLSYGSGGQVDLRVADRMSDGQNLIEFTRGADGAQWQIEMAAPGHHNALNAAAAFLAACEVGGDPDRVAAGLASFAGTGRRFELRGEAGGIRVVDDYAHHPTEIEALLRAARAKAGSGRVLVLFQPHLYSRTRIFATRFAAALSLADLVVVTGVYAAREDPEPGVDGNLITEAMAAPSARFVADKQEAVRAIAAQARPGDLVLTVGAGDVTELGPAILRELEQP